MTQPVEQLSLFPDPPPTPPARPGNARVTSHAAGVAMLPHIGTLQRKVLGYLVARGEVGGTDGEIQRDLGIRGSTERPRRKELEEGGFVQDSGRVRQTAAGRAAVVWTATDAATMESPPMPVFSDEGHPDGE